MKKKHIHHLSITQFPPPKSALHTPSTRLSVTYPVDRLEDGDIINLDVSLYYLIHADLNRRYYGDDQGQSNPDLVRWWKPPRMLGQAIEQVKPGLYCSLTGTVIEEHASLRTIVLY